MPLPAPTGSAFPAPTGSVFPASPAAAEPMFGVNPYAPGTNTVTGLPTSFIDPTLGLPDLAARRAAQVQQIQMAQLASMGLAPASDPHTWTPQEAADQTDNAIAKISTVNPDAAAKLMEARAPTEDDGNSFWDSLKHVAGEILSPGLEVAGRVLDIVGRTASIVPNVAFDIADGGKTDVWGDVGSALTGNVKHNWNSVFQEMGWEGGGLGGFIRATAGLALDIGTDPLTYIIPAGAGLKSSEASLRLAETVGTKTESIVGAYAAQYGDAAGERALTNYRTLTGRMAEEGMSLGSTTSDQVAGIIGEMAHEGEREVLAKQFELADRAFRAQRSRSLSTLLRGPGIMDAEGNLIATSSEVRGAMNKVVADGAFTSRGSTAWEQARAVSSAMGGTRFKVNVPFTNLRYISPAIPGTKLLSEKSLGVFSRFMAGQSGMNRMAAYIASHPEEGWAPMKTWMEQGFDAALDQHPDAINALKGKFKNLGSMFYSASEQMGRITAHFDSAATASRTGLAGALVNAEVQGIKSKREQFVRETAYSVSTPNGQLSRETFLRNAEKTLGVSFRKKFDTATVAERERFADYLDAFPPGLDTSDPAAIDQWFNSLPQHSIGPQTAEEAALREDKLRRMQEVAAALTPAQRESLDQFAAVWDHMRDEVAKRDGSLGDVKMDYANAGKLTPPQLEEATTGTVLNDTVWYSPQDAGAALRTRQNGIDSTSVSEFEDFVGVHGDTGLGAGGDRLPMKVKLTNPLYIDQDSEAGKLLDEVVTQADTEAQDALSATKAAREEALGLPQGTSDITGEGLQSRAQMVTDKIRAEHPESDGVVIRRADGSLHVVVFDHKQAWVSDEGASTLIAERGFFHRTFNDKAKEWLRGRPPKEGKRLLVAEPELPAFLSRQTVGMDRHEAEAWVQKYLGDIYGTDNMPDRIWDADLLKVHEAYTTKQADAIVSEMLGKTSRRLMLLGDVAPAMFGSAPRDQKYLWNLSPALLHTLKQKDSKLARAILTSHAADFRRMEEAHSQLARDAEQYGLLASSIEEALASGADVPSQFVAAARRYGASVDDATTKVNEHLAGLKSTEDHLLDHLSAYDAGYESVPEGLSAAHAKSADLITTVNPDGTTSVKGWHYNRVGAGAEAVYDVNPEELGSSGFHLGTWDQAKHLADLDAANRDFSIGSMDGHDWNNEWVAYDVEGEELGRARSSEIHIRQGETEEDELASMFNTEGRTFSHAEEQEVPPDKFYEEVITPTEAKGKFLGADTPMLEGRTEAGDNYLGGSFTGSGAGQTGISSQERGRLMGMGEGGNEGAIYQNAVEGDARSLVVLNPSPQNVWTANGPRRFEDAVREGRVFVDPSGNVTLKRVAGSRRLRPREDLIGDLGRIREEREQLITLRDRIRKGGTPVEDLPVSGLEGAAASVGRTAAATAKREAVKQYAAGKRLAVLRQRTHDAMSEANKTFAEFHGALAQTKPSLVKVETAGDLGGLTRLHVAGLEGFAMPSYIAEEFHSLVDKHGIGHLRESWRHYVMGPWKRWATYRWPGFHVRNFFGAFFNNWLGGVVERDYVFSWRVNHARDGQLKWAQRAVSDWELENYGLKRMFKERPTYSQVADALSADGIGRANTMAVMGVGAASAATHEGFSEIGRNVNAVKKSFRKADDFMKGMGSSVEDFHRVAAWGRGMAATDGDRYGARAFVMMRHGDYSDLTGAEDFVRDLVPFYKWQRTNIPYQIRMLAENPAKLTFAHDKVVGFAYDAQGLDRREGELQQADWMKQTTAIPIPSWVPVVGSKDKDALKFAMFDLPYADLYNGLNDYMSSALPVVRNVLESYGFKQTLFSGKELTGKYVPLSGVFNLPGVRDILVGAKLAQKGADGQVFMQDKVQNVLMGWPIFSRFRNFTESDPERVSNRVGGLFSMMAGVGVRDGDYTSAELDFYYNEVQPLLDQYKSLGIQLPTMDDIQSGEVGASAGLFGNQAQANNPFDLAA